MVKFLFSKNVQAATSKMDWIVEMKTEGLTSKGLCKNVDE